MGVPMGHIKSRSFSFGSGKKKVVKLFDTVHDTDGMRNVQLSDDEIIKRHRAGKLKPIWQGKTEAGAQRAAERISNPHKHKKRASPKKRRPARPSS